MAFPTEVWAAPRYRLGTRKKDILENEYIYLKGVANLVAHDWVFYDGHYVAVRAVSTNILGPMAIAQANIDGSHYGWFCIWSSSIVGNCENPTFANSSELFISSTPGLVNDNTGSSLVPGSTNTFQINYPFCFSSAIV